MMKTDICSDCKYFCGYDGINEIWTSCDKIGDFKGVKKFCHDFEKYVTYEELEKEVERLKKIILELGGEIE